MSRVAVGAWASHPGKETRLLAPFDTETIHFTKTGSGRFGKALKKRRVSAGRVQRRSCRAMIRSTIRTQPRAWPGADNASFASLFMYNIDNFTKTGSGQNASFASF
jgi:hypothetical protein